LRLNIKSILEAFQAVKEYLFAYEKFQKKFAKIQNFQDLKIFIKERSAYVTQTTLYGYLKTRMGLKYTMMFSDKIFLESVEKSKWNIFAEAASDLSLYTISYLHNKKLITNSDPNKIYQEVLKGQINEGMNKELVDYYALSFERRLKNTNLLNYVSDAPFLNSSMALYKWAPIADELKVLDKEIVLNSVKNKWNGVIEDFSKLSKNFQDN